MNWLLIKNDFKRNKLINLALYLFMVFSATLAVLSVLLAVQTFTSISDLYKTAQPPHFLQMHKGEINQKDIDEFMKSYDGVTYYQADAMIDIYGDNLTVIGNKDTYRLSDCRLDIGLVKQNKSKDLLLNSEHEIVTLKEGEIGIPVILKDKYGMKIGEKLILNSNGVTKEFVIKEIILDSQMNSSMCSSTRILLSDMDYNELFDKVGEKEYLIEAYFTDSKEASKFQTAYENAGLPQNGQAVTYSIIFLLSAITDLFTVFIMLLVSLLLILVAFICIKYTIMAALEEEIGEIGTMKAIGLPFADIRNIYLSKYRALAAAGVLSGFIITFLIRGLFTKHISTTFGDVKLSIFAVILSFVAGGMVFLFISHHCKKILKKLNKVTVVDALVSGKGFDKNKSQSKDGLYKSKRLPINWLMGIREVVYKFKNWTMVFLVLVITTLIILVPIKLMNTMEAPEFITYMGSSLDDIMIEVEDGEKLETGYANVRQILDRDETVEDFQEYCRIRVTTVDKEDQLMNLSIDCGDYSGNGLQYLGGKAPQKENEIAISYLNASEMGKDTGDKVKLEYGNKEREFIISGIYQDVTSGGYTAKSKYDFSGIAAEKYSFSVKLKENINIENKANEWSNILGAGVNVDPMKELLNQTLGGVIKQLKIVILIIIIIGAGLAMLITVLFLKLRMAKDLSEIAILKAIGFSEKDIKKQYLIKIGSVSLLGILTGILSANFLGEKITNVMLDISGLGIKKVELISNPIIQYIICPLVLMALILSVAGIVIRTIKRYHIISIINE